MIRNIIFDIGNVLTDYRWEGFLADKGFDAEMIKKIAKASIMHPLWAEYDRGTWTDEQVLAAFVKDAPELEKELHQAFENIAGMVTPRAYAIPWLQELKAKGYHVYYLSNFSHKAETECAEALNFLPEMEGGILSYKDQLIKPEPEIYQLLLKRYGLKADESVFLDDTLVNVKAAEEQGIHGIHFRKRNCVSSAWTAKWFVAEGVLFVFKTPISTKKIQKHKILLCKKSLFSLHKQNKEIPYKKS